MCMMGEEVVNKNHTSWHTEVGTYYDCQLVDIIIDIVAEHAHMHIILL